ncbi:uncharacterized protein LOC134472168 [Cavia porcellus]|uniref:uncharacterized protein LOC134472168 n=1 Tax=Cavia porcellus TaxID=10141 RepID=UPI002FE12707
MSYMSQDEDLGPMAMPPMSPNWRPRGHNNDACKSVSWIWLGRSQDHHHQTLQRLFSWGPTLVHSIGKSVLSRRSQLKTRRDVHFRLKLSAWTTNESRVRVSQTSAVLRGRPHPGQAACSRGLAGNGCGRRARAGVRACARACEQQGGRRRSASRGARGGGLRVGEGLRWAAAPVPVAREVISAWCGGSSESGSRHPARGAEQRPRARQRQRPTRWSGQAGGEAPLAAPGHVARSRGAQPDRRGGGRGRRRLARDAGGRRRRRRRRRRGAAGGGGGEARRAAGPPPRPLGSEAPRASSVSAKAAQSPVVAAAWKSRRFCCLESVLFPLANHGDSAASTTPSSALRLKTQCMMLT